MTRLSTIFLVLWIHTVLPYDPRDGGMGQRWSISDRTSQPQLLFCRVFTSECVLKHLRTKLDKSAPLNYAHVQTVQTIWLLPYYLDSFYLFFFHSSKMGLTIKYLQDWCLSKIRYRCFMMSNDETSHTPPAQMALHIGCSFHQ